MKTDLHIHTSRFSGCSNLDPEQALLRAAALGLGLIAFTEHGIRWPDEELKKLVHRCGVDELVVVPGQEVACFSNRGEFQGEFLVFGYPTSLGSNKSAEQLIEMVHDCGGVVIAAHPFKPAENGPGFYGCGHLVDSLDVDGLEVEHPDYDDLGRRLAREAMAAKSGSGRPLAGLGCSDAHETGNIGLCLTLLDDAVRDVEALCQEIKACRTEAVGRNRPD